MAERRVIIVHPDGREYSVRPADYHETPLTPNEAGELVTYEAAGFRIERWEDGAAVETPEPLPETSPPTSAAPVTAEEAPHA